MKGRKPIPERIKLARGTERNKKRRQPNHTPAMPDPPIDLDPKVREVWDRAGPILFDMGVLTVADGYALMVLCRAAADYAAYCQEAPPGSDVVGSGGNAHWNMKAAARDKAEARLLKMLIEFGLTPSSRARVGIIGDNRPAADPFDAFLRGKRG